MGKLGANIAQVEVQSEFWSKINWTQIVGWVCSGLSVWTAGKFDVSPQMQVYIVMAIQGIAGLVTVWLRRNSTTITPTAAAKLEKAA
jgi:hypothetical protein